MLDMNDIRKGKVITYEGEPYLVVSAQFLRKQQRRPVMKTILKHLRTGKTKEHSYQQADRVEEAGIESRRAQYLYASGDRYTFMDNETYDQLELSADMVGEAMTYLLEGQEANIIFFEGKPLAVELPVKIQRTVTETPPGVRGDTSTNVMKDATIEGGVKVKVPLFIKEGEKIVIDTRTGDYVARA